MPEHAQARVDLTPVVLIVLDEMPEDPPQRILLAPCGPALLAQGPGIKFL